MIFSEGRCVNEWHLRPLKKGTARLAVSTWEKGIDLQVVPVGFNYSAFRVFGKNVHINFGKPLKKEEVLNHETEGTQLIYFNQVLSAQLKELVYEIPSKDKNTLKKKLYYNQGVIKRFLLFFPALLGVVIHAPLYFAAKLITEKYFNNDHYDSVINGLLMLAYPLYLGTLFVLCGWC